MISLPKTALAIEDGIQHGLHPGSQLYVSIQGEIVANASFGESRSDRSMTSQTLMPWFSAGKPLTAIAVAMLVAQKDLAWTTPVASIIPEFGRARKDTIQIGHILTHTAGFRLAEMLSPDQGWDRILQCGCAAPLEPGWQPGKKAGYQRQASWLVLGEIIQRVTTQPFANFVRNRILNPLGMKNCVLGLHQPELEAFSDNLATTYHLDQGRLLPHPAWENPSRFLEPLPGGNACGPMSDLGKFYEHLLSILQGAPGVIPREIALAITARQRENIFDHTFRATIDWGFGFLINSRRYGVGPLPYGFGDFASDGTFGHGGVQSCSAFADPARQLVVAWACNGMPGEDQHTLRAHRINTAIYEDLGLQA